MSGARSYRDLEIYGVGHELAIKVHKITMKLPRFEIYEEGSQIRRSAKAVPANIVEGFWRRRYKAEFIRFLVYAHSSSEETIEHLRIIADTGSLRKEECVDLIDDYERLSKKIFCFIEAVERGHRNG